MYILGLSCFYHDSAAVLIKDGSILAAAEEERFSRIKHDSDFPKNAIAFCLSYAHVTGKDLDCVVFYEKPYVKFVRILMTSLATFPYSWKLFCDSMKEWLSRKLWIKQEIAERINVSPHKIYFCDHHMSHAGSAFYPSPFKKAAILTLDGVGEWSVGIWGVGSGNKIQIYKELRFPHSLGLLYSTFTSFLGFEINDGEYKVMGMAPLGRPLLVDKIRKLIDIKEDGSFQLDLSYFTFYSSVDKSFSQKFEALFGKPRNPNDLFFTEKTGWPRFWGKRPKDYTQKAKINQYYADVAASIQNVTEEIIVKICRYLAKETKLTNLCMAGGVGLNSVANGRIIRETPFKQLFVQPAAGDSGGALGAALYFYHHILGYRRRNLMQHAFYGEGYSEAQIVSVLKARNLSYTKYTNDQRLIQDVAEELTHKKVVGWFEGRFEWGPRALGHRSILADPRQQDMKDIVNSKIKFREPYRPFAPSVLGEKATDYFLIDNPKGNSPTRFMLVVVPVRADRKHRIRAVVHEGTARVQTVNKREHPRFYQLIKEFERKTRVPVLLNTSFNLRGEPIVATPADAINTFLRSGIDILVLERYVVKK